MKKDEYPDIIPLLKHLCIALQPFAVNRDVRLNFETTLKKICFDYRAGEVMGGLSKLLCAIIDYMPANNTLTVKAIVFEKDNGKHLFIKIRNTGINLRWVSAVTNNCGIPMQIHSSGDNETTFATSYSLSPLAADTTTAQERCNDESPNSLQHYMQLRKLLQLHFAKLNDPVIRLTETNPIEATFLTRLRELILQNIENEKFDANALSISMAISRAQLLRKLKALLGISPGYYIKSLRLEKAKKMLETSDLSVSEIAYKTGFQSPSHFTKIFIDRYGIRPSLLRRAPLRATNE